MISNYSNYENETFSELPEHVEGCNFKNCVFEVSSEFVACNIYTSEFKDSCKFVRSNVNGCTGEGMENSVFEHSNNNPEYSEEIDLENIDLSSIDVDSLDDEVKEILTEFTMKEAVKLMPLLEKEDYSNLSEDEKDLLRRYIKLKNIDITGTEIDGIL